MKLKKKLRAFFTLTRKANGGFTLVELIVVIAILGILGGVGTVGYSSYVKNANKKADMNLASNIVRVVDTAGKSYMTDFTVEGQYEKGLQKPVGFIVLSYEPFDDNSHVKIVVPEDSTDNPLDFALSAAYGSDYLNTIQLKYNAWESGTYASFYAEAEDMINQVETLGDKVIGMMDLLDTLGGDLVAYNDDGSITINYFISSQTIPVFSQKYSGDAGTENLVKSLADEMAKVDRATFVNTWATLTSSDQEGFGLPGREHYSAVRGAYSQCFANYVSAAADHTNCASHAANIQAYGEEAGTLISSKITNSTLKRLAEGTINAAANGVKFPLAVVGATYNNGSGLTENASDWTKCDECYKLWQKYYNSDQARADAGAFYDTMVAASTFDSSDPANEGQTLMSWAKDQAKIFGQMYTAVEGYCEGRSAIVVAVYETDGALELQIIPDSADARKRN